MSNLKTVEELQKELLYSHRDTMIEIITQDRQNHCDELVRSLEAERDRYPESYSDNEKPRHYLNQAITIVKEVYKVTE